MSTIGKFKEIPTEFGTDIEGCVTLFEQPINLKFIPVLDKGNDRFPDYKIWGSRDDKYNISLGGGWLKRSPNLLTGEEMEFISSNIEHESLPHKVYFNLFPLKSGEWEARNRERQM